MFYLALCSWSAGQLKMQLLLLFQTYKLKKHLIEFVSMLVSAASFASTLWP